MAMRWAALALVLAAGAVWAQTVRQAPVNPAFLRGTTRAAERQYGYRPSPVDWSHLAGGGLHRAGLPSSYDLRTQGKLTPVRDQGSAGSCWTFGSLASLESCQLPGATYDFSENHLKNTHGFALHPNTGGGNRDMATAYLARWSGPVNEADDPYNPATITSPSGLSARKHVQDVLFLPDRTGPTDNAAIKTAVMTYGAVATVMWWGDNYYNAATAAFYNPSTESSNHLVAIVGWNDAYSASNFHTAPPGNGAFLVRNSWGASWGSGGYFYISYYDAAVGANNTVFANAEATSNYTRCYQYDPLGAVGYYGYGSQTAWFANVFTAAAGESIAAVSTYAASANAPYTITIYVAPTGGPVSGTAAATMTGTFSEAGYHTVALPSPVAVTAGQKFSVVVQLTTPGYSYPIPVEYPYSGYSTAAAASAGQSYISASGATWQDLTASLPNGNVCVKAFAGTGGGSTPVSPLTAVSLAASPSSPQPLGAAVTLTATPTGSASVHYKFEVGQSGTWTTLQDFAAGNTVAWTAQAAGAYSLRVSARDTGVPATVRTDTLAYTISASLSAVSLSTNLASPQAVGKTVRLSAVKTGGAGVQYQFSASNNAGATWSVLQAYGTTAYKDWIPAAAGSYLLKVSAREGSGGTPVESPTVSYSIAAAPPTAVALAASPVAPRPAGSSVTLTATPTGGGATVQYKFEAVAGTVVTTIRDYAVEKSAAWTPAAAGTYTLRVSAREPALPATVVTKTLSYTIVPVLSAVRVTTALPSPQPITKSVRLTAAKTGGASVQYQFSASSTDGATWSVLQAFGTVATKDWVPSKTGAWLLKAAAREGSAGVPVESTPVAFTVTPAPPTAVALACSPVAPQPVSTAITLTASKTGGTSVEYKFETSANGTTYTTLRDFAAGTSASWTPATAGAWRLRVSAREATLPATVVTKVYTYTVTGPLTGVSLTAGLAAPQPINKSIKLTGVPAGGANVQYRFSVSSNAGATWTVLQAFSTVNYKAWVPAKAGEYLLNVAAREGATGVPVDSAPMSYTVTPAPPTAVTLACAPASPQVVNTAVTLTATRTGGTSVEFKFEASANGTTYTTLQDFAAGTSVSWTPATAGTWKLRVSAREATLPSVVVSKIVAYTVAPALSGVTMTTSLASPQLVSKSIKLTAVKTGGASAQFQFSVSRDGGSTWTVLQAFATTNAKYWVPTAAGSYHLKVAAREGATGAPVESALTAFTITGTAQSTATWHPRVAARLGAESVELALGDDATAEAGALALYDISATAPASFRAGEILGQWGFAVRRSATASGSDDIVLSWPELRAAPAGAALTLVDLATGERRFLRTAPACVIPAARGAGEHRFLLVATREDDAPLRVRNVATAPTRGAGARVEFSLSKAAQATVQVRAVSGRLIRTLIARDVDGSGRYAAVWDGRTNDGTLLPGGAYQAEILAMDSEGRRTRTVTVIVLP